MKKIIIPVFVSSLVLFSLISLYSGFIRNLGRSSMYYNETEEIPLSFEKISRYTNIKPVPGVSYSLLETKRILVTRKNFYFERKTDSVGYSLTSCLDVPGAKSNLPEIAMMNVKKLLEN